MLKDIKFESKIKIKDIPIQWIPRFEFYYSDLPQFPIVYIHFIKNNKRVYGFPVSACFTPKDDDTCDVEFLFLSNVDFSKNNSLKLQTTEEIKERFGISDKIGIQDILECCKGQEDYKTFFKDIWGFLSKSYGKYIPYGKFYEEIFSIVRFVSAWQPKTGRQSEMRMLYNFMSIFGEQVKVCGKWSYFEFFLLPTYHEVSNKVFADFPKFNGLFGAMEKIWQFCFTKVDDIRGMKIRTLPNAWPAAKDQFITDITKPLFTDNKINVDERNDIERLVDAFNRHSWRSAFFIWSIMSIFEKDYYSWSKDFFIKFYNTNTGVGVSPKIVACFLQQGFKNDEVIPIDTWVKSFYLFPLAINSKEVFLNKFNKLGKLERMIWLLSQAKKTNIKTFFDLLWCIRYGDTGNNQLREANPISCYECRLRDTCPGFAKIKQEKVLIIDKSKVETEDLRTRAGRYHGKKISSNKIIQTANKAGCYFICITYNKIPKKIFMKKNQSWILVDEFSGFLLKNQKVKKENSVITVEELIHSLPSFFKDSS